MTELFLVSIFFIGANDHISSNGVSVPVINGVAKYTASAGGGCKKYHVKLNCNQSLTVESPLKETLNMK